MATPNLVELVAKLSPAEQAAVEEFIAYLKRSKQPPPSFDAAIDEFITEHPELLRRLAQ